MAHAAKSRHKKDEQRAPRKAVLSRKEYDKELRRLQVELAIDLPGLQCSVVVGLAGDLIERQIEAELENTVAAAKRIGHVRRLEGVLDDHEEKEVRSRITATRQAWRAS